MLFNKAQATLSERRFPEFVALASTQNASSGTTLVINKPTGTVQGDLMVAFMASNASASWSGDTGWTEVVDQAGTRPALRVAYKVAGASEGGSYTFTASVSEPHSGSILTYRYASYDGVSSLVTGADPLVVPSISPASKAILLAFGAISSASVTLGTPSGMTAVVTENDSTSPSYIICSQSVSPGSTGTRSISTGSTVNVAGVMLTIAPA